MTLRQFLFTSLPLVACSITLLGCPLQSTTSSTLPTASPSAGSPSESSPSASASSANAPSSDSGEPEIVGLPIEEAKKKIKAHGFEGQIEVVNNSEFDASCKAGTVCGFSPRRWYLNTDHQMALYINRPLAIGAPE